MKLLQNPIFVGSLSAVAIAAVAWSSLSGKSGRSKAARASTPAPPVATAPAATPPPPAEIVTNLVPIDLAYAQAREREWSDSPRRDPFGVKYVVQRPDNLPAMVATLNGVWRQGGTYIAVVNQRVVQEGEVFGDYTVHRIEFDRVLFRGPAGIEEIPFKTLPGELPFNVPDVAGSKLGKH